MLVTYAPLLFLSLTLSQFNLNYIGNMKDIVKKHLEGLEGLERLKLTELYNCICIPEGKKQGLHF